MRLKKIQAVDIGSQNNEVYTEQDVRDLAVLGFTTIRCFLEADYGSAWAHTNFTEHTISDAFLLPRSWDGEPYVNQVSKVRSILNEAHKQGMTVIVCANRILGRKDFKMSNLAMDEHIRVWRYLTDQIPDHPALESFELSNETNDWADEPHGNAGTYTYWHETIVPQLISIIRTAGNNKPIIVDLRREYSVVGKYWSMDLSYLNAVKPIAYDDNIIYMQHIYYPLRWCIAQRDPWQTYEYNVTDFGSPDYVVDKADLRAYIIKLYDWGQMHNVPVMVGEFGAIRWLKNKEQWIIDVLSILDDLNINWGYHAMTRLRLNEFNGFDSRLSFDKDQIVNQDNKSTEALTESNRINNLL